MSKTPTQKAKVKRIDLRISSEQKELLEKAASLKGLSLSAYMLSHCLEVAQNELAANQKLVLTDRDRDLFLSLMQNPPEPEETLVKAMKNFQENYE